MVYKIRSKLLFNIHSHHHALNSNQWVIQNLYDHFEEVENVGNYSIGLHPWYVKKSKWKNEFEMLEKYAVCNFVMAIGECGLDKSCTTDFLLQKEVFLAHIILANKLKKPLIIHCVNAYEEIIQILKVNKNTVPVIFHGFNKNESIALSIIKQKFHLSFGKALQQERIQEILSSLSVEQILLETDAADISIETLYEYAAKTFSIELNAFSLQILNNAVNVFGDKLTKDDN